MAYIAVAVLIAILVWNLAIPYIKQLNQETISKRIDIETLSNYPQAIPIVIGTTTISVELALSEYEKDLGLGHRTHINEDEGMLFVFKKDDYHGIWMKNMTFPIDIAWLDRNFKIIDIESDVSPSTYPNSFRPDVPARYVLEVNAGFFKKYGITPGITLRLVDEGYTL